MRLKSRNTKVSTTLAKSSETFLSDISILLRISCGSDAYAGGCGDICDARECSSSSCTCSNNLVSRFAYAIGESYLSRYKSGTSIERIASVCLRFPSCHDLVKDFVAPGCDAHTLFDHEALSDSQLSPKGHADLVKGPVEILELAGPSFRLLPLATARRRGNPARSPTKFHASTRQLIQRSDKNIDDLRLFGNVRQLGAPLRPDFMRNMQS